MTRSGRSLWMDSASRPAKPTRLGCGPFRTGPKIAPNGVLYHPNFSMDLDFNFWIWVNSPLLTRRLQFRILLGELETLSKLPATPVHARRRESVSRRRVFSATFPLTCEPARSER